MSEIVYTYTPRREGDHIPLVPMRDLTQEDLDALEQLGPDVVREVTAPDNPGHTVYTKTSDLKPVTATQVKHAGLNPDHFPSDASLQAAVLAADVPVAVAAQEAQALADSHTRKELEDLATQSGVTQDLDTFPTKLALAQAIVDQPTPPEAPGGPAVPDETGTTGEGANAP